MSASVTEEQFADRLRHAVSLAWQVFSRKVGNGLIPINKEASMQLQYAYLLQQVLPLAVQRSDEVVHLELETGVDVASGRNNIDILVKGTSSAGPSNVAIELKCYRNITSSGGTRGAHDIFMKDIYEDLHVLEEYVAADVAQKGVALVMVDLERFVSPRSKSGQCWAYDTSHGFTFPGGDITVPIGNKPVHVSLTSAYTFEWHKFGTIWFMELAGQGSQSPAKPTPLPGSA